MILSFVYGMLAILLLIPVAIFTMNWMLRQLDDLIGVNFKNEISPRLAKSSLASSIYFGARFIGCAIVIAAIVGRFI